MVATPLPVVLVTKFWAPSAKARAGQVADLWSRAAVARYRCPGKALCLTVPGACTNRSSTKCRDGLCALDRVLVIHVKFACFNLFEYFPNGIHIYDPVDKRVPLRGSDDGTALEVEWKQIQRFHGAIALSSFHARQLTTLGARRVWILPMHSIAAAGCSPLSTAERTQLAKRLPIRHANVRKGCPRAQKLTAHNAKIEIGLSHVRVPGGTLDATLNTTDKRAVLPLRVLIMGDSPIGDGLTNFSRWWSSRWCTADGAPVVAVWEHSLSHAARSWALRYRHQRSCPVRDGAGPITSTVPPPPPPSPGGRPSAAKFFDSTFIEGACEMLHCGVAAAMAYRENAALAHDDRGGWKPAERLLNPLALGIPAVGDAAHPSMAELVHGDGTGTRQGGEGASSVHSRHGVRADGRASSRGVGTNQRAVDTKSKWLASSGEDALRKVEAFLTLKPAAFLRAGDEALRLSAAFSREQMVARYERFAEEAIVGAPAGGSRG